MRKSRNTKATKTTMSSFEKTALKLTEGLSEEATKNLKSMVVDVATECGYNDSLMIRRLMARLNRAARAKANWANEVLDQMRKVEEATA